MIGRIFSPTARPRGKAFSWEEAKAEHKAKHTAWQEVIAVLNDADLTEFNFEQMTESEQRANLRGADLSQALLREANLTHADLSWTNLSHATLRAANLLLADLNGANLAHADLTSARLSEISLFMADILEGAELKGALLEADPPLPGFRSE